MKVFQYLGPMLFTVALLSCGDQAKMESAMTEDLSTYDEGGMPMEEAPSNTQAYKADDGAADTPPAAQNLMLIKEGDVAFATSHRDSTYSRIKGLLGRYGAYVSREARNDSDYQMAVQMTLRVPAANFDGLMEAIGVGVKGFDERSITVHDVSAQYVDLEARLKAKQELESRYLSLIKQAKKVEDILNVEVRLNEVRTEIERMEARRRQLQSQVSVSTIRLRFYEYMPDRHLEEEEPSQWVKALENGWSLVVGFFLILVNIWPLVLVTMVTLLIIYRQRKRKKDN